MTSAYFSNLLNTILMAFLQWGGLSVRCYLLLPYKWFLESHLRIWSQHDMSPHQLRLLLLNLLKSNRMTSLPESADVITGYDAWQYFLLRSYTCCLRNITAISFSSAFASLHLTKVIFLHKQFLKSYLTCFLKTGIE